MGIAYAGLTEDDLTPVGQTWTSFDGEVLEGLDIAARLTIRHDNVTVRNCRVRPDRTYGIFLDNGPQGVLVENVEVDYSETNETTGFVPVAIYNEGGNVTFRRLHVHDAFRGIVGVRNTFVEDSLVEVDRQDLGVDDAHRTAMSFRLNNMSVIRSHLHISTPDGASSALSIYNHVGLQEPPTNCLVQDSLLDCHNQGEPIAGFASYGGIDDGTSIRYLNNHMTKGRVGYVSSFEEANEGNEFVGNRDWPSGTPI